MAGTESGARPFVELAAYEWLLLAFGAATILVFGLVALGNPFPVTATLLVMCVLSALSVHFNADADDAGSIALSAQGMVVAAAVLTFRGSAPLLGPLLVGMAGALWRLPRNRHQWFSIPGNLAVYGLPAVASAALLSRMTLGSNPSMFQLCAIALPLAVAYAVVNTGLVACYVAAYQRVGLGAMLREVGPNLPGTYVPFLFGAVVGQLSLVYGLVVFALASATFVMVQAVFTSYRELVESEHAALEGIVAAVERKDPYTAGHQQTSPALRALHGHASRLEGPQPRPASSSTRSCTTSASSVCRTTFCASPASSTPQSERSCSGTSPRARRSSERCRSSR